MSDFLGLLSQYENQKVRINLHKDGPNSAEGTLKAIGPDYIALVSDKGELVIFPDDGVNALAMLPVDQDDSSDDDEEGASLVLNKHLETLQSMGSLQEFLLNSTRTTITVGRSGHDCVKGYLLHVGKDFIAIAQDMNEIVHIPFTYAKSFTLGPFNVKKKNENNDNRNAEKAQRSSKGGWEAFWGRR